MMLARLDFSICTLFQILSAQLWCFFAEQVGVTAYNRRRDRCYDVCVLMDMVSPGLLQAGFT